MQKTIQVDVGCLREDSVKNSRHANELLDVVDELKTIRKSLDWEIKSKNDIDAEFGRLIKELEEEALYVLELAKFLDIAATEYQNCENEILKQVNCVGVKAVFKNAEIGTSVAFVSASPRPMTEEMPAWNKGYLVDEDTVEKGKQSIINGYIKVMSGGGKPEIIAQGITSIYTAHKGLRDQLNGSGIDYATVSQSGSEWVLLPENMSVYHDNGKGKRELKFVHPDGREAVFDGDTLEPVTDNDYKATFNYTTPGDMPQNIWDVEGTKDFVVKGAGHFVYDMIPYYMFGN